MSVIAFKQNVAKRVQENQEHAKMAVARKRQREALGIAVLSPSHLTQADIDAVPSDQIPQYTNQLLGRIVRGEIKRSFWDRLFGRVK
jgi:hypothetical protein